MKAAGQRLVRSGVHVVLGNRTWLRRRLTELAATHRPSSVLEIGSGKPEDGEYVYSMRSLFPDADFTMSDLDPAYGHPVVDVTTMTFEAEFDLILCISVLEHLVDPRAAVEPLRRALRPGGVAVVGVPVAYPLHDEPADYWRFTEHGLRLIFEPFADLTIHRRGPRPLPTGLLLVAGVPSAQ